ncbi:MAG: UvrD-helicase domain-containing protein, partial [Acidimicrobiales bacterium]|nr:UvrD-helicase domain-containing protein [Acidimicrobiales bacterium]
MTVVHELDLTAPFPRGHTTLVEASAGTGKTFTIAGLAVRHVAETGDPLSSMLLVTFTRAATAELRSRVRAGLVAAERHLAQPAPGEPVDDPVLAALDAGDEHERSVRHGRVALAVAEFDTASISTIHGFCSQVRAAMGVLSAESADAVPTESEAALIRQVCADLYFGLLTGPADEPPLGDVKLDALVERVTRARTLVDCEIESSATEGPGPAVAAFVRRAVALVDDRLQSQGQVSFDSLVRSVRDGLRNRPGLVPELRQRYRIAMIDEFQDTDPVQWEIFRTVFHEPAADGSRPTLVLVGDPKQAIYSFRGGDVYTYLAARAHARPRALGTNQRSDRPVVEALNALGADQTFGEAAIAYHPVAVAARNDGRHATVGGNPAAGLEVRVHGGPGDKQASAETVRRDIASDLAAVVAVRLGDTRLPDPVTGEERAAEPRDFAVLVGSSSHARGVVAALRRVGIPTVLRLRDDVADSAARDQWRTLLHALDRPASTDRAAAAALTWFVGWTPERVAAAVDDPDGDAAAELVRLQLDLAAWGDRLTGQGLAALLGDLRRDGSLVERLLAGPDGERSLTDLEHLAELIQAEAGGPGRGLTAGSALAVLDSLGGTPDDELAADAAQRRIDSDADAVQVMTIHGAKGLEFPFVLLPTLWAGGNRVKAGTPLTYYDAARDVRVVDLSNGYVRPGNKTATGVRSLKGAKDAVKETLRQNCGDQHRLTYVALTRAVHQTVVWWADHGRSGSGLTGLARLLFGGG